MPDTPLPQTAHDPAKPYRGRFAPSPSGPLHHGSLIAALASYLDAKANGGQWLLRIEDVDELRTVKGAEDEILRALEAHGLHWDLRTPNQSQRTSRYREVFDTLVRDGWLFACDCPRKKLKAIGGPYPGFCRDKPVCEKHPAGSFSTRFNTSKAELMIAFQDRIQGAQQVTMDSLGDFVVKRRDGLFAYQLAVVVDDEDQHISHIVRGSDLLDSTPWQIILQRALNYHQVEYAHIPVLAQDGHKLSKQTGAGAIATDSISCRRNLLWALGKLGQTVPDLPGLVDTSSQHRTLAPSTALPDCEAILKLASTHWDIRKVPCEVSLLSTGLLP